MNKNALAPRRRKEREGREKEKEKDFAPFASWRLIFPLLIAILACAVPGAPPNAPAVPSLDEVRTQVAATLTASAAGAIHPGVTVIPGQTDSPTPAPTDSGFIGLPPPALYKIAYADQALLYLIAEGDSPVVIAKDLGLTNPKISSDGSLVAYSLQGANDTAQLWLAHADGSGQGLLVGSDHIPSGEASIVNSPRDFHWRAGTHTLIFDTRWTQPGGEGGPGERINADLWSADADSGAVTRLLAQGAAGAFSVSPDGARVAISRPDGMDVINADGTNLRQNVLAFPFISTYSEYALKPLGVWNPDSASFGVVISSADPLAADSNAAFYRVTADGSAQRLGSAAGNFVFGGQPQGDISPDGTQLIYGQTDQATNATALHLRATDGAGDVVLSNAEFFNGLGWSPDSLYYAYYSPGSAQIVALDTGTHPFALGAQAVAGLRWLDGTKFVYSALIDGQWGLCLQTVGGEAQVLASGLSEAVTFDVTP